MIINFHLLLLFIVHVTSLKSILFYFFFQDMDLIKFVIACFQTYFPNLLGKFEIF